MSTINCYSQIDSTSIYFQALQYYNLHLENIKSGEEKIFIERNNSITEKLPKQVGRRQVIILTSENQKDIYKEHHNKIRHVKIFPARTTDDMIEINFTPYFGEFKGKRKGYFLAVSDWVIIQFKFDCNERKFIYFNTKTGGI